MSKAFEVRAKEVKAKGKFVVVVLGAHASGAEVITGGLRVLGINLARYVMPSTSATSDKGFTRDMDLNSINTELLGSLGQEWHALASIPSEELLHERHLRRRAIKLLRSQLQAANCFVLEDPRLCRLLPFWQSVFAHLKLKLFYVISIRNPLSVARTLEHAHKVPTEKCHYLWLTHIVPSVLLTEGASRVLVDYDLFLDDPQKQIARIACALGLQLNPTRLAEFSQDFIDGGHRRFSFKAEDVFTDPLVPGPVKTAARVLAAVAADKISLDSEDVASDFRSISAQMDDMAQAMNYLCRLENTIVGQDLALSERDENIGVLTQACIQKDSAINQLRASVIQHSYRLKQSRDSLGWKLFKPVRMAKGLLTRFTGKLDVDLIPLDQVQKSGAKWLSSGHDAQFLLMAERAWHGLTGWYWLDVNMVAEQTCKGQLFFDLGEGFDLSRVIKFLFKGLQRIPLFVPSKCRAIRLDLCEVPTKFELSVLGLRKSKEAPCLPFLAQSVMYEALGGREGNAATLNPAGGVLRNAEADYCWRSEGSYPWFVLEDNGQKLRPGWYMIELRIRADIGRGNAQLYFDYGKGYSESASVILPYSSRQVIKRLYHLAAIPHKIRFDPLDVAANFSVERLHFAPVLPRFACNRMLRRLCNRYAQYKDQSIGQIWRDLQTQAKLKNVAVKELLYQRYNDTFSAHGQGAMSYAEWIAKFETPKFSALTLIEMEQKSSKHQPIISVVMPTYNIAETFLRQAIESVLAQSYPYWELCIADDASPKPHVRRVLKEYVQRDPRIKVTFRQENGHISVASNSALSLAVGEYVALLDHDDELASHALYFVAEAIKQNPSAQILYSDEDKIDEKGHRSDPHFKSDWNPDLFFSQNYVSHLGVYRRELLQRIGGFRVGVEGSQDMELLLRCLAHVKSAEIVHIPQVLYHWRMLEGSTALASGEKHYTTEAGIKALQEFFSAQGREDVKVGTGLVPNTYRVRYPIPQPEPLVSLLIPTRDKLVLLEPCVRSILDKTTYQNYEIIILDNESVEIATLDFFKRIQAKGNRVRVLPYHHPFNYSAINNYGVQQARGTLIGLVNNDIEVISPEWLSEMVSHALRQEIGCVGAKLYYDDETIQHAGVIVGLGGVAGHSHKYFPRAASGYFHRLKIVQNLSAVTAACLVVRKSTYEQVNGLEEDGLRVAFNDVDFCLKVREAGYRNLWTPYAELYHHESKSRGAEDTPERIERFNKEIAFMISKWGEKLRCDPYYSTNLTLAREDFSL